MIIIESPQLISVLWPIHSLYYNVNIRENNNVLNNTRHGLNFLFQYSRKMSLQQNVVEPLDASFTELTEATDDTPNLLSCGICSKLYKTRSSLTRHIHIHNAEHICRMCSSLFKTETEYLKHKSRKHAVPYLCSTCGKSSTRHSSLIEHNKQHSDKKETCPP